MMEPELLRILKEALDKQQRKETIERALGRVLRNYGKDFSTYVQMTGEIRELARSSKVDVEKAARMLVSEGEKQA